MFIVWYAVFFSIIIPTYNALAGVDNLLLKAGRMLHLPRWRQLVQIRLRGALPGLGVAARVGVGIGWISVIAAEYLGASHGLGVFITDAQQTLDTKQVLSGMVVIGVIGAVMSTCVGMIARLAVPKRGH